MPETKHTPYTFKAGFVQTQDIVRVIAQIDELTHAGSTRSQLMKWSRSANSWGYFIVEWSAIRLAMRLEPPSELYALGANGEVLVASPSGSTEERVDASHDGPRSRGPMRDLRWIGNHVYASGMARQVYRRERPNLWTRADAGAVLPLGSLQVAGFNSIDGLSEDDLHAVGFAGEFWRRKQGRWIQLVSPTNVVLHRVRVVKPDLAFACGQLGALFRWTGTAWQQIDHGATTDDLWGMEWYQESLYVASTSAVYRLVDNDTLDEVDMKLGDGRTSAHLNANDGVLWSFGPKNLSWTDGSSWYDQTP
jgi:hypothetical protein